MATTQLSPLFTVDTARDVIKNNRELISVRFLLHTNETWLPNVLVQAGFFASGNMVKKNQPKFWRNLVHGETVRLKWAEIKICQHERIDSC